jgi:predicted DNA-binding transcriptional regulator AlpA
LNFPRADAHALTLDDIARDPALIRDASLETLTALLLRSAAIQSLLAAALAERLLVRSNASEQKFPAEQDQLLNAADAAAILSVSREWLYRRATRLNLAVKLDDGTLRFSQSAIRKFIDAKRVGVVRRGGKRLSPRD